MPTSRAAATPVTETVNFIVNTVATEHKSGWKVLAIETGIVTYGETQEEALALNREANVLLVTSWKSRGAKALMGFLNSLQIWHDFNPINRAVYQHEPRTGAASGLLAA